MRCGGDNDDSDSYDDDDDVLDTDYDLQHVVVDPNNDYCTAYAMDAIDTKRATASAC